METNKLIAGIVAAAIAIIVLAGVLMPALSNATTTTDKFTNDGLLFMTSYTDSDTIPTISWDHTDPFKLTVGTDEISLPTTTTIPISIIMGDNWAVRYLVENNTDYVQLFGEANGIIIAASTSASTDMTISFSSGTATFDNGSTPTTQTYTKLYAASKTGEYVMKDPAKEAYLNGDSEVYVVGRSQLNYPPIVSANIIFEGNIDDGFTATVFYPTSGYTASNYVVNSTAVDDHKDLYKLSSVKFDVTDTVPATASATYSQFLIPYEVTAERSVHLTDAMNVILNVIPLLIIVAVLLGVVAVFILRRE